MIFYLGGINFTGIGHLQEIGTDSTVLQRSVPNLRVLAGERHPVKLDLRLISRIFFLQNLH